jgi:hypothetical protein
VVTQLRFGWIGGFGFPGQCETVLYGYILKMEKRRPVTIQLLSMEVKYMGKKGENVPQNVKNKGRNREEKKISTAKR